jgi:hypothetical protein
MMGRPAIRKSVPKISPRGSWRKVRCHTISTRLPRLDGVAVSRQLLPGWA